MVNSDSRGKVEICPRVGGDAGRPLYAEEEVARLHELGRAGRKEPFLNVGERHMMVVVFRARRTEAGDGEEYYFQLQRMSELARKMPGYISHKPYVAEDGERLTLFEWESPETLRAWASHPEHVPVKELGRQRFYTEYHLQVCEVVRESKFTRQAEQAPESG